MRRIYVARKVDRADARIKRSRCHMLQIEPLENRRLLSANSRPIVNLPELEIDPTWYDDSNIIVRFRSDHGCDGDCVASTNPSLSALTRAVGSLGSRTGIHKINLRDNVSVESALAAYRANPNVLYAEPDYRVRIAGIPDDPLFSDQWDFHNVGQAGGIADSDIDGPEAWDISTGNESTVVAVIDTGVNWQHEDLADNMWVNPGEIAGDGIDNDQNGYVDDVHGYDFVNHDSNPMDDHNHGTHVAGTIGAIGNNGLGVAGVNWNVQIMALKFLDDAGSGTTSDAIEAVQYAVDNGAHISNNSWGGDPFSQALYDVIEEGRDQGHIFVAAAGNGNFIGIGQDNDQIPFYPASYDLDNIVTVAATDRNDQRAFFSNFGATSVDLGAPGVTIRSTIANGGYGNSDGTSMAAPHVAGALSLVRDYDNSLSYGQIIDRVLYSADPIDALQGITVTGGRLNVASALVPDTFGPQVTGVQPDGLVLDPISSLRIAFSEGIDATTFTLSDISQFSGPSGDIAINSLDPVTGTNNREFEITFDAQSDPGTYEIVIDPGIQDRFGNAMDQDEDGVGGETDDDQFSGSFVFADAIARFDFGTGTSAVAPGYVGVSMWDDYDAAVGHGWQDGWVIELSRGGDPLTGDFNYTEDGTFAVDLPNGEYDAIVTLGDSAQAHDQMAVYLEDVQVDTVDTLAGESIANTYRTSVSDGQLNLRLVDLGGSDQWVMINGLDIVAAGPDATGPNVTSAEPSDTVSGTADRITLSFNEAIQAASFTVDDVAILEGPGGAITPTAINQLAPSQFEVVFAEQSTPGLYRMVVGPNIHDLAGNLMDQDGDGNQGETDDDQFEATFTLEAGPQYVGRFDFGTGSSPVADGYVGVSMWDDYDPAIGHGWTGWVIELNRGGDPLTGDFHYTEDAFFSVDLPNGGYDVVVTLGDSAQAHDQMGVYLEDVQVDTVTTASGEFAANTYSTNVTDGQLNLRLVDLGGSDQWVMINALDILVGGPDISGPSVSSAEPSDTVSGTADRFTLNFNEAIADGSFTVSDVAVLEGPSGAITPTAVNQITTAQYEVVFAEQTDPGLYRLVVGPDILDLSGNAMDQNGDGTNGGPDDQFEATFTLEAGPQYVGRFDFGTGSSPVADGYTGVSMWDGYDPAVGHGWTGWVIELSRGGDPLTGDFHYTEDAVFSVDLPNGGYDVVVTLGDSALAHDQMGVFLEDVQVDTVTTAGGEFAANTYNTTVTDGQLNLRLVDQGGSDQWVMINALDILVAGPDVSGPRVTSAAPEGTVSGTADRFTVTFNEAIQDGSFTLSDVVELEGPSGSLTPTAVNQLTAAQYEVVFAEQSAPGLYRLVIGPDILDLAGNPMDQNDDGTSGDDPLDQFEATFTLEAGPQYVGRFDFGTGSSPVADGYTGVSMWDYYDAATGWGWTGWVIELSRSGADPLTRDFNYTEDAVFSVDVANGEYDIVVTLGDSALAHDQMGVFLEDVQVDTVTTASGQFAVNTYRTTVTDGQLNLRLDDLGGTDKWVMINALDLILLPGGGAQSASLNPPLPQEEPAAEPIPTQREPGHRQLPPHDRRVDRFASRPNTSFVDGFFAALSKSKDDQELADDHIDEGMTQE